jgi:acetyl esterase/lipase
VARDRGGPALTAQILDAPTVDDRLETPSMRDLPDTPLWRAEYSPVSWKYYLGEMQPGSPEVPLYAAPARADVKDLAGLPPASVTTYQVDVTRDEVLNYARLLIQAGVPCDLHHYGAAFHLSPARPKPIPKQFNGTRVADIAYPHRCGLRLNGPFEMMVTLARRGVFTASGSSADAATRNIGRPGSCNAA